MTVQTFRELLAQRPCKPLRLLTSIGQTYEIRHPEMAFLTRTGIQVGTDLADDGMLAELEALARGAVVDRAAFAPDGRYRSPDFVTRGYYVDIPFECQECGEPQTWTAAQ